MISPARILKFMAACVALLVTVAWVAPASAQECKGKKVTVTGKTIRAVWVNRNLQGRGNAMKFAIEEWEREVATKFGEEWNQWSSAKDTVTNCEAEGEGIIARRKIACTISGRPCQTREDDEDKNGERRKDGERTVEREDDADRRRKSDRFTYSEGKRRGRDRYRDRDRDDYWDRDRYRREYRERWGAYDYDGRYVGYGRQYYGGYRHRHRHHDGYRRHRYYGGGRYDHYPRTWIPSHLCGEAQLLLYECGYGVAPDSYCGYRTSRAITRFQYRHGLRASGYPNERTMMALINTCGRRR